MSDQYTPSMEEIRESYWAASGQPRRDSNAWGEFDRALAAFKRDTEMALLDSLAAEMVDGVSHIDPALAWAVNLVERKANELRKEQN